MKPAKIESRWKCRDGSENKTEESAARHQKMLEALADFDEFRAALAEAYLEVDAERLADGVRRGGKIYVATDVFTRLGGKLAGHEVHECMYMAPGTIVAVKEPVFDWWGILP